MHVLHIFRAFYCYVCNGATHSFGAKYYPIALNIEKLCFREKNALEVFDFKKCDECFVNMKFPSADQNLL